jgi:hypothetical protein
MCKKVLTSFLVIILVAPLNVGAAAWMAMSMGNSEQHVQHMTSPGGDHSAQVGAANIDSSDLTQSSIMHEHDASDCEEHCASCTNHCSSLGIVTSSSGLFDPELHVTGVFSGTVSSRLELLFRPPILA